MLLLGDRRAFFTLYGVVAASGLRPHQLPDRNSNGCLTDPPSPGGCLSTGCIDPKSRSGSRSTDPSTEPLKNVSVGPGQVLGQNQHQPQLQLGEDGIAPAGLRLFQEVSLALQRADVVMTTRQCAELPGFPLSSFDAVVHYVDGKGSPLTAATAPLVGDCPGNPTSGAPTGIQQNGEMLSGMLWGFICELLMAQLSFACNPWIAMEYDYIYPLIPIFNTLLCRRQGTTTHAVRAEGPPTGTRRRDHRPPPWRCTAPTVDPQRGET